MKQAFVFDDETNSVKINRAHPLIWLIFTMDLLFGPLVMLFSKRYTFDEYIKELKGILKGEYVRN